MHTEVVTQSSVVKNKNTWNNNKDQSVVNNRKTKKKETWNIKIGFRIDLLTYNLHEILLIIATG